MLFTCNRLSRAIFRYGANFSKNRIVRSVCFFSYTVGSNYLKSRKHYTIRRELGLYSRLLTRTTVNDRNGVQEDWDVDDSQFKEIAKDLYRNPQAGHNVLIIQPRLKGSKWENRTLSELKLSEALALVDTLEGWKIAEKIVVPSSSLESKLLFGKGKLEELRRFIQRSTNITAVFIGIDILTAQQNSELEKYFKLPIYDRFQIILQIFHLHAHTKEAKLQLALAEIPYLRIKLSAFSKAYENFEGIHHVGGDGETYMDVRRKILNERELKLKKALEKVKQQRQFLRQSDMRKSYPIIAVVGYTNCGKTTLIKALTNDNRLQPKDKLFATLDVTLHMGILPSNQKVLFIDTVGFISDVPTTLIQSFKSTLEEVMLADLVVHIRDISHPNTAAQKITVLETLEELDLPKRLQDSILEVQNKIDLVEKPPTEDTNALMISATEGTGLSTLLEAIEEKVFNNTGHFVTLLRIPNGGDEYSWLLKETAIRDAMPDIKDANYLIVEVIITEANLAKFKHSFGDLTISVESLINQ